MMFFAFFFLAKFSKEAGVACVICGTSISNCNEATYNAKLGIADDTSVQYVKYEAIIPGTTIATVIDLYFVFAQSGESMDITGSTNSGLKTVHIFSETPIPVSLTLLASTPELDLLNLSKVSVEIKTPLSVQKIIFYDKDSSIIKGTPKTVTLLQTQSVSFADAHKLYNVSLGGVVIEIDFKLDLATDQTIRINDNGYNLNDANLIIDADHLPSSNYRFKDKITVAFPATTTATRKIIFSADSSITNPIDLALDFAAPTNGNKIPFEFDDTWQSSKIENRPTIKITVTNIGDIIIPTKKTVNASFTIKTLTAIVYQYPITNNKVIICYNYKTSSECTPTVGASGEYYVKASNQSELTSYLSSIEKIETLVITLPTKTLNLADLSALEGKITTSLSIEGLASGTEITLSKPPKGIYDWVIKSVKLTFPKDIDTIINSIDKTGGTTVNEDRLYLNECKNSDSTKCLNVQMITYIYEASISIADDYPIEFEQKSFILGTGASPTKIAIGNGTNEINAKKVEIRLDVAQTKDAKGIILKAKGENVMSLKLTIDPLAPVSGATSFPITFNKTTWSSVATENVEINFVIPKANSNIVSVVDVPSNVKMFLKDSVGDILDMRPINTNKVILCISKDASKCTSFKPTSPVGDKKELEIFYKIVKNSTEANSLITSFVESVKNLQIVINEEISESKPLEFTPITVNLTSVSMETTTNPTKEPIINLNLKSSNNIETLDLKGVGLIIKKANETKKVEINNVNLKEFSSIKGDCHNQNIYIGIKDLKNLNGGIQSDRFYVNVLNDNEKSFVIFDEDKWNYGTGEDKTKGDDIIPGNQTFESSAYFVSFEIDKKGNLTLIPKNSSIKKALPISIFAKEKSTPSDDDSNKNLILSTSIKSKSKSKIKSKVKSDINIKQITETENKMMINFDKNWKECENMTTKFVVRFIGSSKAISIDKENVNTKIMEIVEKNELPPSTDDKTDLEPDDEPTTTPKSKGLDTGAIVGIVIGCVAVVTGIVVGVVFYLKKKKARVTGGGSNP